MVQSWNQDVLSHPVPRNGVLWEKYCLFHWCLAFERESRVLTGEQMAMGCFDFCRTTARQGQRLKCSIHPQTLKRKGNEDVWCRRVACTSCLNLRFKSLVDYNDVLEDLNFSFVSKLKNFFSKSEKVEMDNIYSSLSPSFVLDLSFYFLLAWFAQSCDRFTNCAWIYCTAYDKDYIGQRDGDKSGEIWWEAENLLKAGWQVCSIQFMYMFLFVSV